MNKRKFQRKLQTASSGSAKKSLEDTFITNKAKLTALHAVEGVQSLSSIGNFIFLSTQSGDAWMLDHRESRALRLAEKKKVLPINIIESKETFRVKWTERFLIEDDTFITAKNEKMTRFSNYPIRELVETIKICKST